MTFALGTAAGKIVLDYDGKGVDEAKKDVEGLQAGSDKTNAAYGKLSKGAAVAGLAIAGGLAVGVNAAANFEQRMSAIGAVSGATGKDFDSLRNKALDLGRDTQYSAGEAAGAIEELAKAGLSVPDILNGAADAAVALAAAGEIALPEAATIASNAMNMFNLTAAELPKVADLFAGAANASAIGVSDLGQALQQVGAVANLAGVSLEDTTTAIALMGNAGIAGSDAGTSLKSMFMRLNPSTKKAREEMKELGIITKEGGNAFYDAQGNMKSLSDISGILKGSLKGMTKEQKQAALQTLFGSDAIRAAAILANNGSKGFDKLSASMGKVSAADVAKKRMDNFKGSLEQMKGSLETAGIAVGTVLIPPLRTVVDAITSVANAFLKLDGQTQKIIIGIIAAVGALLLIVATIMKVIIFINTFRAAMVALRGTMIATWAATLGPILLVIAAIALVIAIIVILWKKSETFRDIVTGVWEAIKSAASAVADWFMGTLLPGLQSVWDGLVSGVQAILGVFSAVWNAIVSVVTTVFNVIKMIIMTYINLWVTIITTALNVIKAIWGAIWGTFGGLIKAVFGLILAIIQLVLAVIVLIIQATWNKIKAVTSAVWNGIMAVLKAVWNGIKAVVMAGVNLVRAIVTRVWTGLKVITSAVWNAIMGVIRAVWGKIGGTVMGAVNKVKSVLSSAWNAIKSTASKVWNALVTVVGTAIGKVIDKAKSIKDRIVGFFSNAGSWLLDAGKRIIQGLIDGITGMISKVTDKLNALTAKIKAAKGPPEKDRVLLESNGELIIKSLIRGFDNMTPEALASLRDLTNMIPPAVAPMIPTITLPPQPPSGGGTPPLRLLSGELSIDKSGRAFITGVATDVLDGSDDFDDTLGRMG